MADNKYWVAIDDAEITVGSVWKRRAGKGTLVTVSVVVVDRPVASGDNRRVVRTRYPTGTSRPFERADFLDQFARAQSEDEANA